MPEINKTRTVFIREGTTLPMMHSMGIAPFLPGWHIVKNLDRQELTREIEGANWNFFYLAGEIRATVPGRDLLSTLRRAVKRVLAKQEGQKFNSIEITKVVSKRFLGIPFMSVTAHSRHIQRGIGLVPAKDFVLRRTDLSFGGGGPVRPFTCRAKGKLGEETRLPMIRKIKQWVPIDGTRWRNEFVNGHENHGVGAHYGVAPGGVMARPRELLNTAGLCGLCGLRLGGPGFTLHQTRNRDSL